MMHEDRRASLIAQCAQQRIDAAEEIRTLLAPASSASRLKLPLTIAGIVLGMIATRGGRAMPLLTVGMSLWKLAKNVLPMLR
ncbi:MAG: hypothetical protein QFF03_24005, partial [Pseudomonadota bacterium]|nr:hypothetical protein [Pseudomonadota bacterium]